ncbi:LuxR C-terminal-related transcriptional regulator [Micromonospora sp. NPDC023633]|uniref:LuxR C-terminal-related transcriptional regulator n=1 Tax=Micromonospora sp. NPDC023633 TaxID=3154320 RepID=UPI0034087DC9
MTVAARPALNRLLTPEDVQVLQMVADGLTQQQIGKRIGATHAATSRRLQRLYARLGATNAPHAVAITIRAGLLPAPNQKRAHQQ